MSWFKKIFTSQSSQETKVYYQKDTQTDQQKEEEKKSETEAKFEELQVDDSQVSDEATKLSQKSWWSGWSRLSQPFTSKYEKRDCSSDEEEEDQWWKLFCSESNKKVELWQGESSSSSQTKEDKNKNEEDNKNEDKDQGKVSFYIKVGKNKRFKYM